MFELEDAAASDLISEAVEVLDRADVALPNKSHEHFLDEII
jgi:hypothetical protein